MTKDKRTWFITGISSGLGKALARAVVLHGDYVIGTIRNQAEVDSFNAAHQGKAIALKMDITNTEEIGRVVDYIENVSGRLDVLVNNAGIGFACAIEESSTTEVKEVFEANFFGALHLTQALLPLLRSQKAGHIIQISSHGGIKAFAGFGIYNASKFALEGFSEALAAEVLPLGIKVTIVEPGPFRTNFAGSSFREAAKSIEAYNETAGIFRERMKQVNGKQEGDPAKAAQAIIEISTSDTPPLRLPLGKIAIGTITAKLDSVQRDLDAARQVAESSVYA